VDCVWLGRASWRDFSASAEVGGDIPVGRLAEMREETVKRSDKTWKSRCFKQRWIIPLALASKTSRASSRCGWLVEQRRVCGRSQGCESFLP
jgi:hypothetical protein